jgi:hypothetical protein
LDFQRQATCSCLTFEALIWSSGEYFVLCKSSAYCRHSPFDATVCADADIAANAARV